MGKLYKIAFPIVWVTGAPYWVIPVVPVRPFAIPSPQPQGTACSFNADETALLEFYGGNFWLTAGGGALPDSEDHKRRK